MVGLFGFPRPSGFSMAMAPKYRPIFLGSMIRKRWINQSIQSLYRWHAALRPRRGVDLAQWSDAPRSLGFRGVGRRYGYGVAPRHRCRPRAQSAGASGGPGPSRRGFHPPRKGWVSPMSYPALAAAAPPPRPPPGGPPGPRHPPGRGKGLYPSVFAPRAPIQKIPLSVKNAYFEKKI